MIASLIIALYLFGIISQQSAFMSLYVAGGLLLIAEIGVVSFGLITLNALLALYAGYAIQTGSDYIFGLPIDWGALFGIAFVEFSIIMTITLTYRWLRGIKVTTGQEAMIGAKATILSWKGTKGQVRYEGEIWRAVSDHEFELKPDDLVNVESVNKMDVKITL